LELEKVASRPPLLVYDLGFRKEYGHILEFQKKLVQERIQGATQDSLILVEHDHVLTLGRSSHLENLLIKDLPIFEIERGGDVTYHGPGQLVAYPIVSLEKKSLGVRQFVELLEDAVVETLAASGLGNAKGMLGKQTGVWIEGKRKIASIGVAVSHWVSYHGLALNVNTDLSYFQKIKPCGFDSMIMTSMSKELGGGQIEMSRVKDLLVRSLSRRLAGDAVIGSATF
jgi:lipoyl(octanoyl) transferase